MVPLCREARELACAVGAQIGGIKIMQNAIADQWGDMGRGGHEQIVEHDVNLALGAAGADLIVAVGDIACPIFNRLNTVEGSERRIEVRNHTLRHDIFEVLGGT